MKLLAPGTAVDGFVVHECLHAGGMAHIYRVSCADPAQDPGFPLVMKVPRMTAGDGAENIVGFEVELQILPALQGPARAALRGRGRPGPPALPRHGIRGGRHAAAPPGRGPSPRRG